MVIVPVILLALLLARPAAAQVLESREVEFANVVSGADVRTVKKYGAELMAKAEAAKLPARTKVARVGEYLLANLISPALCDRVSGCPLLVFHDMTKTPILTTTSFSTVLIEVRRTGTWLVIHHVGATEECRISVHGRAHCAAMPAGHR